ncbi:1-acyl-sn-glycerol-3-phosphate acyltransferase [Dysgonomonas sp. 25]|uniref:1-acyl-sn-glycerol-3-phosphate acyltransferase n=1 Tax=Dysgonomonas sp. 25 TaxID=2302933 RepID=UPI0013D6E0E6|nr:1-acyl-sn-glycerol-3-phosphate acyltransferase [Dysgonomonas sp. 25]NDV69159.1 hypothetical protein [Dysgonomonas sp. 25]
MSDKNAYFDDIRPLYDSEVREAIQTLLADPGFQHAVGYILPDVDWEQFSAVMSGYKTRSEFQHEMVFQTVTLLASRVTAGLRGDNWENIDKDKSHVFLSNHRDIVLDASFLNILLSGNGFDTTEIAIGDNLLIHPWIDTLVRLNKSFIVRRGVSVRQMLMVSKHLSEYVHYAITQKHESIWMAQREGRAKDGNDRTQDSLLKMLALAPEDKSFIESLKELNLIPLAISYEFDPCDYLKAREFQLKRDNPDHKKIPWDDLISMETGMLGQKGHVVFRFGTCINPELDKIAAAEPDKRLQVDMVTSCIDNQIYRNYEIYPCNYIAYDLVEAGNRFADKYTKEQQTAFEQYVTGQIAKITDVPDKDEAYLRTKIYEMYCNPLKNHLEATGK